MPSQMLFIWQTYQDNVDPFVKVLHTPTVTQVLQQCRCQLHELAPSMEALFMCIAYAAIVSLSEDEVGRRITIPRITTDSCRCAATFNPTRLR